MRFCKKNIHISNVINTFSHFCWLSYVEAVQVDDVGRRRCVISDERGERTKNAAHELEVQTEDL